VTSVTTARNPRYLAESVLCLAAPDHSTYFINMKAVQVLFDERLLKELDRDAEVRRDGRSAVLRRAASAYLRRKQRTAIRAAYERAYGKTARREDDFEGWTDEASWPEK